jgi:hypothetical protein
MEPHVDEELVPVMVPRSRLTDVYALLAAAPSNGTASGGLHRGWSAELIREAYAAASDRMKALLDLMASRPGERLTAEDFMAELGVDQQDFVNGVLGAFGRLTNQRFAERLPTRENTWPFTVVKDIRDDRWTYEMPEQVAEVIQAIER